MPRKIFGPKMEGTAENCGEMDNNHFVIFMLTKY